MADESVSPSTPQTGLWRIRLKTRQHPHTWCTVGAFPRPRPALVFATDLVDVADGQVQAVQVQHRNRRAWKPAWFFRRATEPAR